MTEENRCTQCKDVLSADAPHGLCPRCLLKRGLETQTQYSEQGAQATGTECAPPTPEELTGLFPDLEILELIGRGGMGVVYKARQKRLNRLVALKILAPRFSRDSAFAERFVQEARAMAMLNHPHIVAVHDFGEVDGLYYFLMEFVDGVNLRRLLDTNKLASEEALAIVPQICEALQYAHDHGVVHRDIKPENVLLDKEGRVKIADFGIAKLVGVQGSGLETQKWDASDDKALKFSGSEPLTAAGQIVGTPQYMAPEQIETPQAVDHRADIYSLGVVFYQMLTGELPTGHVTPPSKKVQIDVRLDEVVLRAMEREPDRRYQQASEVKTEVEGIATRSPVAQTDDDIEQARQQVKWPAIGLVVTGIFAWLVPLVMLMYPLHSLGVSIPLILTIPIILTLSSSLMIFAALKMKQLQMYRLAVTASILTIIISPSNLIGLPIGIWALVVLSQREVRAAFLKNRETSGSSKGSQPQWTAVLIVVIGILLSLLAVTTISADSMPIAVKIFFLIAILGLIAGILGGKMSVLRMIILAFLLVFLLISVSVVIYMNAGSQTPNAPISIDLSEPSTPKVETEPSSDEEKNTPPSPDLPPTGKIQPFDLLQIHAINTLVTQPINGFYIVEPDGNVSLGPEYGRANVKGLNVEQAAQSILKQLNEILKDPDVQVILAKRLDQRLNRWRKAVFPRSPYTIEPKDSLSVKVQRALLEQPIDGLFTVESKGTIPLGPAYGRVQVKGLTLEAAEKAIKKHLQEILTDLEVQVTLPHRFVDSPAVHWKEIKMPKAPYSIQPGELLILDGSNVLLDQPIEGVHLVEPAGTVALGPDYGRVKVEGLSLEEAEKAIRKKLLISLRDPHVSVTLGGWEDEG